VRRTPRSPGPAVASVVCALLGTVAVTSAAQADTTASLAALPAVVYDAHRGGGMEARENSLSGLRQAFEGGDVQVLDVDTRLLKDGTVVLMHDETVDRASTTSGRVSSFTSRTWSDVRLDLGSWLDPTPPVERAPTLAAVLDEFGGRMVLTLEVKDRAAVGPIRTMIVRRGLKDSVLVNTNDPATAKYIDSLGLHAHLWRSAEQMRTDRPASFAGSVQVLDADIDARPADFARFADAADAAGVRLWAHTITTRAERDRARAQGATGFITDDPAYLTGRTNSYPLVPTLVRVHQSPAPTQVSDQATAQVVVSGESGPGIPGIRPTVSGRGVSSTSTVSTAAGLSTLRLGTVGAEAGAGAVTVTVAPGSDAERRWGGGSRSMRLRLSREDLQLRPSVTVRGRQVTVRVRLLDSAASGYTGPRAETGAGRTVAGLARATLHLTVRRGRKVVHRAQVAGADPGTRDGDGAVTAGWRARRAGRYTVTVTQR
jgi:glycerophosphoryl diester phosphodiesterase